MGAACTLNPQPIPPAEGVANGRGGDAGAAGAASDSSEASASYDSGVQPKGDAGTLTPAPDAGPASTDGGADGSTDSGADAALDASVRDGG